MTFAKMMLLSVLAGTVLFTWGFVSHVILDWHDPAWQQFGDEAAVAEVIRVHAPGRGLYVVPYEPGVGDERMPRVMLNFVPAGTPAPGAGQLVRGWLINVISALLVVLLWRHWPKHGRAYGVGFFPTIGVAIGLTSQGYYWNWFEFPFYYSAVMVLDTLVGWSLVGIVTVSVVAMLPGGDMPSGWRAGRDRASERHPR